MPGIVLSTIKSSPQSSHYSRFTGEKSRHQKVWFAAQDHVASDLTKSKLEPSQLQSLPATPSWLPQSPSPCRMLHHWDPGWWSPSRKGKTCHVSVESPSSRRCTWLAAVRQLPRQAWLAQGTGLEPEPAGPGPASWGRGNVGPRAGAEG